VATGRAAAAEEAAEQVRRARPACVLGPEHVDAVERFVRRARDRGQ
jgi:hypothetical protein